MGDAEPLISVVMSVYNEERYIIQALTSVLGQTIGDFEVIIVDDGSTDRTVGLIEGLRDERIRLSRNEKNQGLTKNLNRALEQCRGKYIARMDGDDICLPERFARQVAYMERHPAHMLIGCHTRVFGEENMVGRIQDHADRLRIMMLVRPVLAHPTFLMRRELIFEKGYRYDESFRSAQDYDLAQRVAEEYPIGIVQHVLLNYRTHKKQVSSRRSGEQYGNADRVRERQLEALGIRLDERERKVYQSWAREERVEDAGIFSEAQRLIMVMCGKNEEKKLYPEKEMEYTLKKMLFTWLIRTKSYNNLVKLPQVCNNSKDYRIFLDAAGEIAGNKLKR